MKKNEMDVEDLDLSTEDFRQYQKINFEFLKKEARLNMRMPEKLLQKIKERAKKRGMPYTRLVREILEKSIVD